MGWGRPHDEEWFESLRPPRSSSLHVITSYSIHYTKLYDFAPYAGIDDIPQGLTGEYLTERLTDEVCNKIEQVKNDKFFIYFAHYNVHSPYEAKADLISKYKTKIAADPSNKHRNPVMAAMIESLDASVGKVMDKLNKLGIADKTMIIVMGDNGVV